MQKRKFASPVLNVLIKLPSTKYDESFQWEPSCSVRISATEGLLYIQSNRSYMAPVCAGSWITVRHNRRVTVNARADGSSKYACNSVVSLSENTGLCSHLHTIFIPFNASSDKYFHTHCTLFHALEYRLLQGFLSKHHGMGRVFYD